MFDLDLALRAWSRPGARQHGLLLGEFASREGAELCVAREILYELVSVGQIERHTPRPGEGRYPPGSSCRGRPPCVYRLTPLGEAVLNGLEARDSAGDG